MGSASESAEPAQVIETPRSKRRPVDTINDDSMSPPVAANDASPAMLSTEAIASRAYDLFLERGGEHGHDIDDWLRAERELRALEAEVMVLTHELNEKPSN